MRVTLRDVADRAGVSIKTVSNVVNGYTHVSPEMREHVQAVLDDTGYRPNLVARNLRAGRTGVIALALPELDNPYFAELTRHVVEAAQEHDLTVLVDQTDGLRDREVAATAGIRHRLLDGLIMSPVSLGADDLDARDPTALPLVLLGEKAGDWTADHVAIDNVAAARQATTHLLELGRTRVAALGHQPESSRASGVAHLRRQGWDDALRSAGIEPDPAWVAEVPSFGRGYGAAAMAALLDGPARVDAVFCFNDTLALGAIHTLARRGLRVPEDVAVIGIDDIEDGRYSVPTLSTIAPAKDEIGRAAVRMLVERLGPGGGEAPPRDLRASFELVARESTLGRR
ncbi:MAG: LacI family DNA-binding transcriptional regulator [Nocardioides sp.]